MRVLCKFLETNQKYSFCPNTQHLFIVHILKPNRGNEIYEREKDLHTEDFMMNIGIRFFKIKIAIYKHLTHAHVSRK